MAAVGMGAGLDVTDSEAEPAAEVAEERRELADEVYSPSCDVSESLAGPVAVAMADEKLDRTLSALLLIDDTSEAAELLTDDRAESMALEAEAVLELMEAMAEVSVTVDETAAVVSWAEARAARPAKIAVAKRILMRWVVCACW
jgi:hypothetical protein